MIDTDKYEWDSKCRLVVIDGELFQRGSAGDYYISEQLHDKAVAQIVADAPLLLAEVKRLREELDGREAYIKRLSEQLVRATKWAYQQVCHNDSAMMDFDDYVWGEEK